MFSIFSQPALRKVLKEIIDLLEEVNDKEWLSTFEYFYAHSLTATNNEEIKELDREIRKVFGGMGSFSDFILYNKGELLVEQNEQLNLLQHRLFKIVTK
jgi:hypothetical protein